MIPLPDIWLNASRYGIVDARAAMTGFLKDILPHLQATSAAWLGAARNKNFSAIPALELFGEWFTIDSFSVSRESDSISMEERYAAYMEQKASHGIDPGTQWLVKQNGQIRAFLRSEHLSDADWNTHWYRQGFCKRININETLVVGIPIDEDAESYLSFSRRFDDPPFTEKEKNLALTAAVGLGRLHRSLMFLCGSTLPSSQVLSPQERLIFLELLKGRREKDIAISLDSPTATVHHHITSIYRKLKVSGRTGLLSRICNGL